MQCASVTGHDWKTAESSNMEEIFSRGPDLSQRHNSQNNWPTLTTAGTTPQVEPLVQPKERGAAILQQIMNR